jgi:hypothetical protein
MGARAGLDRCGKSRSHRGSIPGLPSLYQLRYPPSNAEVNASSTSSYRFILYSGIALPFVKDTNTMYRSTCWAFRTHYTYV